MACSQCSRPPEALQHARGSDTVGDRDRSSLYPVSLDSFSCQRGIHPPLQNLHLAVAIGVGMRSIVVVGPGQEALVGRHVQYSEKRFLGEVQRGIREPACVRQERFGKGREERGLVVLGVGQNAEDAVLGYPSR